MKLWTNILIWFKSGANIDKGLSTFRKWFWDLYAL